MIIALPSGATLATRLASQLTVPVCTPDLRRFPDGEAYVRLPMGSVLADVAIVASLRAHDFLDVAFVAGCARDAGARRVGLLAPYLGYLRQDDAFHPGEAVTARHFARLVSSTVDWLVTVDPHLHRLASLDAVYSIPTAVAHAASAIASYVAVHVQAPVLIGPDAESAQWVHAVAELCDAPAIVLTKTRRGSRDVSVTSPPPEVLRGRTPVILDDIVSTGRTMIEATRMVRAAGSAPPLCVAIHAVFADSVVADLAAAGARELVTCNTLAHATNRICVADALAETARPLFHR